MPRNFFPGPPSLAAFALFAAIAFGAPAQSGKPPSRARTKAPAYYWYYYTVDTTQIKGISEVAFDAAGNLKIGYRRGYEIWYGELKNHKFAVQKADTGTGGDARIAFALDNQGNPRVLYQDAVYQTLYLASHDGQKWTHKTIDQLKNSSIDWYHIDMKADNAGGLHTIYTKHRGAGENSLYYAYQDKDVNIKDTGYVDPGLNGKWNSIDLDDQGKPVIAFFRHSGEVTQVNYPDGAARKTEIIGANEAVPPQGFYVSLQHDTGKAFYIAHRHKPGKQLRLLHGVPGGAWTGEVVDSNITLTLFNSPSVLALGKDRAPYIAYADTKSSNDQTADSSRLLLARKQGGAWAREVVDSGGVVGEYAHLAMSPDGLPAISYFDRGRGRLRAAVARATAPTDTNNNGIPDYQEGGTTGLRGKHVPPAGPGKRPGKGSGKAFDSRGKAWETAVSAPPTHGVWFRPDRSPAAQARETRENSSGRPVAE